MKVIFLGTSSMVPTANRNHSGVFLRYEGENILVDCGEGIQRQFKVAKLNALKITKILISHWHGDHVLGLPGLMQTMASGEYSGTLEIYVPKGTAGNVHQMFDFFTMHGRLKYKVIEVKPGVFFSNDKFSLEAFSLEHCKNNLGYVFIEKDKRKINVSYLKKYALENNKIIGDLQKGNDIQWEGKMIKSTLATTLIKGRKIGFILDTKYFPDLAKKVKGCNVLISEASFCEDCKLLAKEKKHLTAKQAARIARDAKVGELYLTHFSQRYRSVKQFEKEAKEVFNNVKLAKDFLKFEIKN
jgi:ribonuclease Z